MKTISWLKLQEIIGRELSATLDDMLDNPEDYGLEDYVVEGGEELRDINRGLMVQQIGLEWSEN